MVEFRILGPLEVVEHDQLLALGGPKQRALLAILLLHRGEVVSTERLSDELWGERPPASAAKTVQAYVSNLRRALGDGLLVTRGHGYLLDVEPGQVDASRFDELVKEGRRALQACDPRVAAEQLHCALALWRGSALADFAYEEFCQSEVGRLEEAKLAALEDRIDADLALGEHAALVPELDSLAREHPLRERFQGQLMLALYRAGRQADALERYQRARHRLVDDLGIEPGPELQQLERAILAQDPALAPPPTASTSRRPLPLRDTTHGARLLAVGAALLLAAAIAAGAVAVFGLRGSTSASLAPDSLGLVDPATNSLRAAISMAGKPARLHVDGRNVWVTSDDARTVSLVRGSTPSIANVIQIGEFPSDFAVGAGGVWVIDRVRGRLVKVSPDYASVVGSVAIGSSQTVSSTDDRYDVDGWSVATGAGGVWVTDGSSVLRRAAPATGRIAASYDEGVPLNAVALDANAVWAISGANATVLRIDPLTGKVTARIAMVGSQSAESAYPIAIATGLGSVWVLNATAATVTRIDPVQAEITTTIPIGTERVPRRLAVGDGAAWVADADGTLTRIDATTNVPTSIALAASLYDVGVGAGGVWVTSGPEVMAGRLTASAAVGAGVQPLPRSQCSPVYSAPGARPRYLVVSDLPVAGPSLVHDVGVQVQQAIVFELLARGFRAGRYAMGYQACDDWNLITPATPSDFWGRCTANMRAYAADPSVIGVIGPYNSGCAVNEIAIANRAPGGALAMISPSATAVGLTHRGPGSNPGEPAAYYPTGTRNFVRLIAADDVQGAADALLAQQLGLHRVFAAYDTYPTYGVGIATSFTHAASRLGLGIAGAAHWPSPVGFNASAPNLPAIAAFVRAVARTHPDGIFLGGNPDPGLAALVHGLRTALPGAQLIGSDGLASFPDIVEQVGQPAEGLYVSVPAITPSRLTGSGKQFFTEFGKQTAGTFYPYTAYAAQATDVLLHAIARSNATRASVTRALLATHLRDGIIGSFSFTPTGDTTAGSVTIIRVEHGQPVPLRVITPPATLTAGG